MVHVANYAVSLGFLLSFARDVPNGYTTADVVQKIIIPATKDKTCRYVFLPSVGQESISPARYFISHRWAADFTRELVTLVAGHFADLADVADSRRQAAADAAGSVPRMQNAEEDRERSRRDAEVPSSSSAASGPTAAISAAPDAAASGGELTLSIRSRIASGDPLPPSTGHEQQQEQQQEEERSYGRNQVTFRGSSTTSENTTVTTTSTEGSGARIGGVGGPLSRRNTGHCGSTSPSTSTSAISGHYLPRTASHLSGGVGGSTSAGSSGGAASCRALSPSLTSSAGHVVNSQYGPGSPRSWSRGSLRARLAVNSCKQRTAASDGTGVVVAAAALGRTESAGSCVGLGVADEIFGEGAVTAAHLGSPSATTGTTRRVVLPGAITITPIDAAGGRADVLNAAAIADVGGNNGGGEFAGLGGAVAGEDGESFSGSLNPLLARPSFVRHQWPHQQFNSMGSRSGLSVSSTGGASGGSFKQREGHSGTTAATMTTTTMRPLQSSMSVRDRAETSPSQSVIRWCPSPTTEGTKEPHRLAVVQVRSTVTGVLPYRPGPLNMLPSGGTSHASRRASSASGFHRECLYGSNGVAVTATTTATRDSVASRTISEVSDTAAAADPTTAESAGGLSCSSDMSRSGGSSSRGDDGGGTDATDGAGAHAAITISNSEIVDRLHSRFVGREALLRDTYIWLDVFAINQHPVEQQADDLAQLQEVVEASEATLLVLDRAGLVLSRIWCLYEIWHTVRQRGPKSLKVLAGTLEFEELVHVWGDLEVERAQATFSEDRDRILTSIRSTTGSDQINQHIKQALVKSASLDLEMARATAPRTRVHGEKAHRAAFLLRTAGSGAAALTAAREAADVFCSCMGPAHPDTLKALREVAGCHRDLGSARQAVGLLEQQVIPFLETAYGFGHTESGALDELGMLYYKLGDYDNAYDMLLASLSRRLRQLQLCAAAAAAVGAPQLSAALAVGPCASALTSPGTWCTAGGGGPDGADPTTIRHFPPLEPLSGEHLAMLLAALKALVSELEAAEMEEAARRAAAEPLLLPPPARPPAGGGGGGGSAADYTKDNGAAAAAAISRFGSGRVVLQGEIRSSVEMVGLSLHSLGLVQRERAQRHRSAASAPLLREARELMEASVALLQASSAEARGLSTMDARANLATLVMDSGEYQAAEQLLRENLALTERVYGKDHPHTATAANNLALCLKRQQSVSPDKALEALSLYRRCLDVCAHCLGERHPETLVVATNLGVLLADQRQWSESERLLTWAVAALPPQLGERHPDVLSAYRRLAEVLELKKKLFEAEAMYRLTLQLAESCSSEGRDHGLILECRERLERVQELLEAAARGQASAGCCAIS